MTTETATPEKALADVRKEIDAIDHAMQDLLQKRTELVVEVAEAKATTDESPTLPPSESLIQVPSLLHSYTP